MKKLTRSVLLAIAVAVAGIACGGGVPVRVHIDEFTMEVSIDEVVDQAFGEMKAQGLFPPESRGLPVLWPDSLPAVSYRTLLKSDPMPIDLSPEPGSEEAEKYKEINKVEDAIKRIEMNRLILRVEQSNLTIGLPELRLQVADQKTAKPDDRLAWRTIGILPATEPGFVGDNEFEFLPSGESFLRAQLRDELKEFALRVVGKVELNTDVDPRLPSGAASVRLIVVATFFVEPKDAL